MKKSIACIAALLAFGMTGAMAEEMAVPPSQFITARVPYLAWTGFYVGINGGFALGNSSVAFAPKDPAALAGTCGGGGAPKGQCITSVDFRRDGAVAGGQFGYNWQVNSQWLIGAEADYQWSNLDGSASSSFRLGNVGATNTVASQTVDSFGTVRARAGVLLAPPLLLYGTGGFAFGQVHENLRVPAVTTNFLSAGGFSYACTIGTACFAGSRIANLVRMERRSRRRVCDYDQPDLSGRAALCALERADGDRNRHRRHRRNGAGIYRCRFLAGLLRGHARRLELQVLGRFSGHSFPHVQNVKEAEPLR